MNKSAPFPCIPKIVSMVGGKRHSTSSRHAYDGLIFDLDRTLVDSSRDIVDSWNDALLVCGFPSVDRDKFKDHMGAGELAAHQTKSLFNYCSWHLRISRSGTRTSR
jgi:hypothetical protein